MKQSTKNRILIGIVIFLVLVIGGAVLFHVAVNNMFSRVTRTIGESTFLQSENAEANELLLPGFDPNEPGIPLDAQTLKKLEKKVSTTDKMAVLSLLERVLPQKEYAKLLSFVTEGVSQEELTYALQILRENLTDDDKRQIMQYYAKYLPYLEN